MSLDKLLFSGLLSVTAFVGIFLGFVTFGDLDVKKAIGYSLFFFAGSILTCILYPNFFAIKQLRKETP